MKHQSTVCLVLSGLASSLEFARFDHESPLDHSGIWARHASGGTPEWGDRPRTALAGSCRSVFPSGFGAICDSLWFLCPEGGK